MYTWQYVVYFLAKNFVFIIYICIYICILLLLMNVNNIFDQTIDTLDFDDFLEYLIQRNRIFL